MSKIKLYNQNFFVGIGAQKAGTTWLGDYFNQHPQVGFSPIKELHYFDVVYRASLTSHWNAILQSRLKEKIKQIKSSTFANHKLLEEIRALTLRLEMIYDENRYRDYFELLSKPEYKAIGEITPSYSLLNQEGFEAIDRLMPNTKFIFIMRDPADRYWSQLRYHETMFGSEKFQAKKNITKLLTHPGYQQRTDYKQTLNELFKVVNPQRVCILFYETLMNPEQHETELKRITDFLAIDYIPSQLHNKKNVSKSIDLDDNDKKSIVEAFKDVYEDIFLRYPSEVPSEWKKSYSLISQL